MPPPTTEAQRTALVVHPCVPSVAAFPQTTKGRPSHRVSRGRLGVHSPCGLPARRRPSVAFFLPGTDRFVTFATAGINTRLGRPLPGQDLHLLDQRAFPQRTWSTRAAPRRRPEGPGRRRSLRVSCRMRRHRFRGPGRPAHGARLAYRLIQSPQLPVEGRSGPLEEDQPYSDDVPRWLHRSA